MTFAAVDSSAGTEFMMLNFTYRLGLAAWYFRT